MDQVEPCSVKPLVFLAVFDKHSAVRWHPGGLDWGQVCANHAGTRMVVRDYRRQFEQPESKRAQSELTVNRPCSYMGAGQKGDMFGWKKVYTGSTHRHQFQYQ